MKITLGLSKYFFNLPKCYTILEKRTHFNLVNLGFFGKYRNPEENIFWDVIVLKTLSEGTVLQNLFEGSNQLKRLRTSPLFQFVFAVVLAAMAALASALPEPRPLPAAAPLPKPNPQYYYSGYYGYPYAAAVYYWDRSTTLLRVGDVLMLYKKFGTVCK